MNDFFKIIISVSFLAGSVSFAQNENNQFILELSDFYAKNVISTSSTKTELRSLGKRYPERFDFTVGLVKELSRTNNAVLSDKFMTKPDSFSLKIVYVINALYQNLNKETIHEENYLIDSLLSIKIDNNELIDQYYSRIFVSCDNKNRPFDMSKYDFDLEKLVPNDSIGQSILFLRCMEMCGKFILGYMRDGGDDKIKEASRIIKNYPLFNGKPYYFYRNFQFEDFSFEIYNDRGPESYLRNYLGRCYFGLLYNHISCLKVNVNESFELWKNSILSEPTLYYYANTNFQNRLVRMSEIYKQE